MNTCITRMLWLMILGTLEALTARYTCKIINLLFQRAFFLVHFQSLLIIELSLYRFFLVWDSSNLSLLKCSFIFSSPRWNVSRSLTMHSCLVWQECLAHIFYMVLLFFLSLSQEMSGNRKKLSSWKTIIHVSFPWVKMPSAILVFSCYHTSQYWGSKPIASVYSK